MIRARHPYTFSPWLLLQALAVIAICAAQPALAQQPTRFESRADLESRLKSAEATGRRAEAFLVRYRLEHGDFHDGDRIAIKVLRGAAGFADTLVVGPGQKLTLQQMGDVPLQGVLRSELISTLTTHMAKFLRDPVVDAVQFVRVGILGHVGRPGFYYAPAHVPLPDVLMAAGGPTPVADLGRVKIMRDGDVVIDEANTRTAISGGFSIDMLNMQAGDEISVGAKRQTNWPMIMSIGSGVLGLIISYVVRN